MFKIIFKKIRKEVIGINKNPEHIYFDNQKVNIQDYHKTVEILSACFNVSKSIIKYRIDELKLITYTNAPKSLSALIENFDL